MSLKVDVFKGFNPYPHTVDKYTVAFVNYPGLIFAASEATIPTQEYTEETVWWCGKPLRFPTSQQELGVFECTLVETSSLSIAEFITKQQYLWNGQQVFGQEIHVSIMDQFTGAVPIQRYVIKDAFLQKIEPPKLRYEGATEVMTYHLTFKYSNSYRSL